MAVTLPPKGLSGTIIASNMLSASISIPSRILPTTLTLSGDGGALGGGSAEVSTRVGTLVETGTGGALGGGVAGLIYGGNLNFIASGGALGAGAAPFARSAQFIALSGAVGGGAALFEAVHPSVLDWVPSSVATALGAGTAPAAFVRPHIAATLPLMTSALSMPSPFDYIHGRMKLMASTITALIGATIEADLPLMTSSIDVADNITALIDAELTLSRASLTGGEYSIRAGLPLLASAITGAPGLAGRIDTQLPTLTANIDALAGVIGDIAAVQPASKASLSGIAGLIAVINAQLTRVDVSAVAYAGVAGTIAAELGTIHAALTAGFGATGSIGAGLPLMTAALSVLAQATTQQLVMVVNTQTNAVSTYTAFPFNSFCELDGVYYGAGPAGLCRIDTGAADGGSPIAAGLGTGMMTFEESHLKRVLDSYITLRTTGNLTLTVTVDEGAKYAPVAMALPVQATDKLFQRRVGVPKGLVGKAWQFELNNTDGADFDFAYLGVNVAVSSRRIASIAAAP